MIGAFVFGMVVGATLGGLLVAVIAASAQAEILEIATEKGTRDELDEIYD